MKAVKILRKLHKRPGIVIVFIAILFASSGFVMNHRQIFPSLDISRNLLPPNYRYDNRNPSASAAAYSQWDENDPDIFKRFRNWLNDIEGVDLEIESLTSKMKETYKKLFSIKIT